MSVSRYASSLAAVTVAGALLAASGPAEAMAAAAATPAAAHASAPSAVAKTTKKTTKKATKTVTKKTTSRASKTAPKTATKKAPAKSATKTTAKATTATSKATKAAATARFVSRVTAQSRPVTDRAGHRWDRLPATLGSSRVSSKLAKADVARTTDDVLYRSNVWGTPGYLLPVPAAGRYDVKLLFAEDTFAGKGQRVFDIKAEGRTVVKGLDIAGAVGKGAAYSRTLSVNVTDGELNLEFVKRVDQPLVSAVEVVGATPVDARLLKSTSSHVLRLASGNVFQQRVDTAPLAANSARTAGLLRTQVLNNWGGVAAVNAYGHNVAFHRVPKGTKRIRLGFFNCQRKTGTPRGLYDGPKHFVDVPVPADAKAAAGTDAEMTIYDPATDQMWDLWEMRRNASTGAWEACWGGRMDDVSKQQRLAFPEYFGTAASGLSLAAGMVSVEDVKRGRIDHAVAITAIDAARWDRLSWPAVRSDGLSTDPDAVREGQRLRLDPRIDLDSYDLTPFGRLVARAAQEYGFIVVDKGGAVAVQTEFGLRNLLGGHDAWDWLLGGPSYSAMRNFPWAGLQALPVDYGRPKAN